MPQPGDSAALASAKMYSAAGLRIVADATSITATDAIGSSVPLPPNAVMKRSFFDAREGKTMTTYDVDVNLMRTAGTLPANGVMYVAGTDTASSPAVRLVNGALLPNQGLTVVSQNPVYIVGNYNCPGGQVDTITKDCMIKPNGTNHPPAAVLADAVTVLSNAWMTNNS